MDNPECTLLSLVKMEDPEIIEMKQEPDEETADMEFVQVEDSLSIEDMQSENGGADNDNVMDAVTVFSEEDFARCESLFQYSRADLGSKRRLRFSETDDMVLLRQVAALNPYKCIALWKDVTHFVALNAGKNFSVRTIREHTDLLMNTFSLRGVEACLRRTPPDLWEKKKKLLEVVHSMWKRDVNTVRSSVSESTSSNKSVRLSSADNQTGSQKSTASAMETSKSDSAVSKNITPQFVAASSSSSSVSSSSSSSLPSSGPKTILLKNANVPITLHLGNLVQPFTGPALLTSAHPSVMHQLSVNSQSRVPVQNYSGFPATVLGKIEHKKTGSLPTGPDLIMDTKQGDAPRAATGGSSTRLMVDRGTSPGPVDCAENTSVASDTGISDCLSSASHTSVNSSTSTLAVSNSDQTSRNVTGKRKKTIGYALRMNFLVKKHRDLTIIKKRELELEWKKVALEKRKLLLEERKINLEEEKWLFERKIREEKLVMMSEDREHKIAVERRQQNMIDILLELRKND